MATFRGPALSRRISATTWSSDAPVESSLAPSLMRMMPLLARRSNPACIVRSAPIVVS
jgi:hypothetical protein